MLRRLEVQNLAVIREAALDLSPGLNVLTGETGAGKSLLVDALALLLGERLEGPAQNTLVTAFFQKEGVERILSRRIGARSTPRIDGEVVTLKELAEEAERWVALHAQHAALALLSARSQQRLLDALLEGELLAAYREAYARREALLKEKAALLERVRAREERLDFLRFQLKELEEARLRPDEDEALLETARRLRHATSLKEKGEKARAQLEKALSALGLAGRELEGASRLDPGLTPLAQEAEEAEARARALLDEVEAYLEGLELDPEELEKVEARLALLERLKRKYGPTLLEVLAHKERLEEEIRELEGSEERLGELEEALKEAEEALARAGRSLSQAREKAARWLSQKATEEVRALGMPEARFQVALLPLPAPGPEGLERVQFLFSANPALPPGPLEAASGGELSRVMLALALLTQGGEAPTVVFDEIDVGVGGEAAWRVAERLYELAQSRQVLVVTHLPQIAARAQAHFRVVKDPATGVRVERVEGEERVRELARMLSGSYTEAALRHARSLLGVE
ncbi:DNA repair protein RecN [Thermus filiformis]|uniref:DNA repair protein RecN n=1 Tax=Thermus filiformis TaxID=276 RepID=A0A0A2WQK2_THEFI|nr:DNA recombination protein RecN [Thermus filiformis]KGQ21037.1 DNA recombination protein RecN [Thermus filiformis]